MNLLFIKLSTAPIANRELSLTLVIEARRSRAHEPVAVNIVTVCGRGLGIGHRQRLRACFIGPVAVAVN